MGGVVDDSAEQAYLAGKRAALLSVLRHVLKELGYDEQVQYDWIVERESAIAKLRELCAEHGDNDWPDNLNLSDVIEKHLGRYLSG